MKFLKALAHIVLGLVATVQSALCAKVKKPKGTTSFAVVMMVNERSEVLLLRRKGAVFGAGLYSLPGGKIESGESALEAAKREVGEELGVLVDELQLVHVVDRQGPNTEFYVLVFKTTIWHGDLLNRELDKCGALQWFPLKALPEDMIPAHKQALLLSEQGIGYSPHGWDVQVNQ